MKRNSIREDISLIFIINDKRSEGEDNILLINLFLHLQDQILSPWTVEAGLDLVLLIESGCVKVHVHQTIVDPVVLGVHEVVVDMEILSCSVDLFLSVTVLVVQAVL